MRGCCLGAMLFARYRASARSLGQCLYFPLYVYSSIRRLPVHLRMKRMQH